MKTVPSMQPTAATPLRARRPLLRARHGRRWRASALALAAATLSAAAWAAHMPGPAPYADVQGVAQASNHAAGSGAWVWFRNGELVGTPAAFNGGSWHAGPQQPGATEVWAVTGAGIGTGQATTSSAASLNRGEIKAVVQVVSDSVSSASGQASARIQDTLWFTNTSGGWLPVTLTMAVDGAMHGLATQALSRVDYFSYIGLSGVGGGTNAQGQSITANADGSGAFSSALYGEFFSNGTPFQFRDQLGGAINDAIAHWRFTYGAAHAPDDGLFDYRKTITLYVPSGETTLVLDAWMNIAVCAGWGSCDFGHTASLRFGNLPDGLSIGSRSGVFLADVPAIPEPGTWAMWLAGLGALGGLARRRRRG